MISIIVPCYNAKDYVTEQIECILRQTYKDFELILVDDASDDGTGNIIDSYSHKDDRVIVIHRKVNGGLSEARNEGYKQARGEYILFLDDDDVCSEYLLENMVNSMQPDSIVCVGSENISCRQLNRGYTFKKVNEDDIKPYKKLEMLHALYFKDECPSYMGCLWGILFPKQFLKSIESIIFENKKILPITYFEDVHLNYRIMEIAEHVIIINKTLIYHRISKHNFSRQLRPGSYELEVMENVKMQLDYLKKKGNDICYDKCLISYYLVVMKTWWIFDRYKKLHDNKKKADRCLSYFADYYKCEAVSFKIEKSTTVFSARLFKTSPVLWKLLIGNPWFLIKYRLDEKERGIFNAHNKHNCSGI